MLADAAIADERIDPPMRREGERAVNGTPYWRKITLRATQQAYWVPLLLLDGVYYTNSKVVTGLSIAPGPLMVPLFS